MDIGITLIFEPCLFWEYISNNRIAGSHGKSTAIKRKEKKNKPNTWDFITLRVFHTTKETRNKEGTTCKIADNFFQTSSDKRVVSRIHKIL
jgi:hypothetical protein